MNVALRLSSGRACFQSHIALLQCSMRAQHAAHPHVLEPLPHSLSQEWYCVPAGCQISALIANVGDCPSSAMHAQAQGLACHSEQFACMTSMTFERY